MAHAGLVEAPLVSSARALPEDVDLAPLRERIEPVISGIDGIQRVEGQRRD